MEEADRVADEVAVIDHGKIVAQDSPAALKENTGSKSLEDAFIALTGHTIRDEEASSSDMMRKMRQVWRGGRR
jgi:ABC-2 type transport system ATP-binding protein